MTLTQINAYIIELAKAKKEELELTKQAIKNARTGNTQEIKSNTKLSDLASLGFKVKKKK